ncbi:GIY-YIG nuclease family protein [Clostridium arbusti]|uniref:GIY-YIG nuclease family protein n=1 Tax=Clostridium arbusti TaxID=1137848 RepID=UPI0035A22E98
MSFEKEYKSETNNLKYKFIDEHEERLSKWMKDNLIMHFVTIDNPMEFEIYLINTYEPLLNLKDNNSEKNRTFRRELSQLRTR